MPLMREYTEIIVEESLLPQVVRELVALAENQNHVEVVHGTTGRVILVHPKLAEFWYAQVTARNTEPVAEEAIPEVEPEPVVEEVVEAKSPEPVVATSTTPEPTPEPVVVTSTVPEPAPEPRVAANIAAAELSFPVPVKRGPGRPRKNPVPSVSNGEES